MANQRARSLFDLCAGFVYTQVLAACVELDLFEQLRDGAEPVSRLAERNDLSVDAVERLARAASALGLLEFRGADRVGLGQQGAALLGNPSVFAMIRHHAILYADLADPAAFLRRPRGQTRLGDFWGYANRDGAAALPAEKVRAYSELMAVTQGFIAEDVLAAHSLSRYRRLLDVGGGAGAFATAAAKAARNLSITLFDLPAVSDEAAARFAREGIADRARAVGGDFLRDDLPSGADIITLIRVLHDHDEPAVRRILQSARRALAPGGALLVAEPMADTPGAAAMGDAYFGVYLWAMGAGRPRSSDALCALLREAGFSNVRRLRARKPVLAQMLLARP